MSLPKILVVDDDTAAIQLMHSLLAGEAEVSFARSGENALQVVETVSPDLILMDVEMPGMGGIEACRRLKADPRFSAIPVIFVTSFGDEQKELDALRAGAVDFLSKPVTATQIQARVQAHWRLSQQVDGLLHQMRQAPLWSDRGKRAQLLLVYLEDQALASLRAELAGLPIDVHTADGLESALGQAKTRSFDLLLADGTKAQSLVAELSTHAALSRVPVLALAPAGDPRTEQEALQAGATDVLTYPWGQGVALARVQRMLQLRVQALVAERQPQEDFHRLADEQLAQVLLSLPAGVIVVDSASTVRLVNRWACNHLELSSLAAVGAELEALLPLSIPQEQDGRCSAAPLTVDVLLQHSPAARLDVRWVRLRARDEDFVTFLLTPHNA